MPVCLTGDVHHQSLRTADQTALDRPEPQTAVEYAEIVESFDLQATLFVTGRTADEDAESVRRLGEFDCIEIGGHNYGAFTIPWLPWSGLFYSAYRRTMGRNCPKWLQRRGISKTISKLESIAGENVNSWRDHAFKRDENTYNLLSATNVEYVSDQRSPNRKGPYSVQTTNGELTEVPINVPPDHDHIKHGTYDPPDNWSDPFSGDIYSSEEWINRVLDTIEQIDADGGVATVLAHPACMALVDDFGVFQRLCEALTKFETVTMNKVDNSV